MERKSRYSPEMWKRSRENARQRATAGGGHRLETQADDAEQARERRDRNPADRGDLFHAQPITDERMICKPSDGGRFMIPTPSTAQSRAASACSWTRHRSARPAAACRARGPRALWPTTLQTRRCRSWCRPRHAAPAMLERALDDDLGLDLLESLERIVVIEPTLEQSRPSQHRVGSGISGLRPLQVIPSGTHAPDPPDWPPLPPLPDAPAPPLPDEPEPPPGAWPPPLDGAALPTAAGEPSALASSPHAASAITAAITPATMTRRREHPAVRPHCTTPSVQQQRHHQSKRRRRGSGEERSEERHRRGNRPVRATAKQG
jgi:hypothetical protein